MIHLRWFSITCPGLKRHVATFHFGMFNRKSKKYRKFPTKALRWTLPSLDDAFLPAIWETFLDFWHSRFLDPLFSSELKSPDSNNVVFQKAGVTPNILGNFKSGGNQGTIFRGSIFYTQTVYPQIFGETQKVGVYPVFIFHILSHIKNKNSAVNRHIER